MYEACKRLLRNSRTCGQKGIFERKGKYEAEKNVGLAFVCSKFRIIKIKYKKTSP